MRVDIHLSYDVTDAKALIAAARIAAGEANRRAMDALADDPEAAAYAVGDFEEQRRFWMKEGGLKKPTLKCDVETAIGVFLADIEFPGIAVEGEEWSVSMEPV